MSEPISVWCNRKDIKWDSADLSPSPDLATVDLEKVTLLLLFSDLTG